MPPRITSRAELSSFRDQVLGWMRGRLWAQVLVGLALGILVGFLLGPEAGLVSRATAGRAALWLSLPGKLFLGLISMVLVPLVFVSIIQGLNGSQSSAELRSVGGRLVAYVVITTSLACVLGIGLARWIEPGAYVGLEIPDEPPPEVLAAGEKESRSIPDMLLDMLPTNPSVAVQEQDMLAIVLLAMLCGVALRASEPSRVRPLMKALDGLLAVSMTVVKWAMFLTPYAVLGMMAELIARVGIATLVGMTAYVLTVLAGLAGLLLIYLLLVGLAGGRSPLAFLRDVRDPLLLAFSTSSSVAVMPLSIDTAVHRLETDESAANLIIPLGATINMAGTAIYQSIAVIFLAQMSAVDLSVTDQALIVVTLVASSIGAPGTPGVGVVILGNIAAQFGIPLAGLVLILGVDRILDMSRTTVNLAGDLAACVLFGRTRAGTGPEESGLRSM